MSTPSTYFQTPVWLSDGLSFPYAETDHGVKQNTGVCFSGGGTRSMAATIGQLRGLNALKMISHIDYISCVSGGSWASGVYTYYKTNPPDGHGPISDEQFLGPVTAPQDIQVTKPIDPTQNWLGFDGPQRLGATATQSLARAIFQVIYDWGHDYIRSKGWSSLDPLNWERALKNIPWDKVWTAAVGLTYFKPFGLFQLPNPFDPASLSQQAFFSLDDATVQAIKDRNTNTPAVTATTFYTVRTESGQPKRPYLVVNSSVIGPAALAPFKEINPIVFEYTPLYVGSAYSPYGKKVEYGHDTDLFVGAGFVAPFAFGGTAPADAPTACNPPVPQAQCTSVPAPPSPFTLVDASGASSSAFASAVEENPRQLVEHLDVNWLEKVVLDLLLDLLQKDADLFKLAPEATYWPATQAGGQATTTLTFGDGGILENYGLISLLRRKLKTIVVFVNTETKLNLEARPEKISADDIDSYLPPLFGIQVESTAIFTQHNQVFPKSEFAPVLYALQQAKEAGKTVMAKCVHTVAQNDWWGVQGVKLGADGNQAETPNQADKKVTIVWVYNDRVPEWEKLLSQTTFSADGLGEVTLAKAIAAGNPLSGDAEGPFQHFPNYKTIGQNHADELVELTPQQVNLLADLSCWNITNADSAALFQELLTS